MSEKITAKWLQKTLVSYMRRYEWKPPIALVPNVSPLGYEFECDLVQITKSGLWHEYEIKTNRYDWLKDFKKGTGWHGQYEGKHERLKEKGVTNRIRPNYFWFVTPPGLIRKEEVPEYAGLMEVGVNEQGRSVVEVVKAAKRLHGGKLDYRHLINLLQKLSGKCLYR